MEDPLLQNRARMILMCHEGKQIQEIAVTVSERRNTVIKWRDRYLESGINGLIDGRKSSSKKINLELTERVKEKLRESPPNGKAEWDEISLANTLGVSRDAVGRILRKEKLITARSRRWYSDSCSGGIIAATDLTGLYLTPGMNAFVLSCDAHPTDNQSNRIGKIELTDKTIFEEIERDRSSKGVLLLSDAINGICQMPVKTNKKGDFSSFLSIIYNDKPRSKVFHVIVDRIPIGSDAGANYSVRFPDVQFHYTNDTKTWEWQVELFCNMLVIPGLAGAISKFLQLDNEYGAQFVWYK